VRAELGPDPKWLLPVIRQQLANGGEIKRLAAVVASWARYAEGTDERGQPIEVVDKLAGTLTRLARRWREDPAAFFANRDVFGRLRGRPHLLEAHGRIRAESLPVEVALAPAVVERSAISAGQQTDRLHQLARRGGEAFVVERRLAAQALDEIALEFEQGAQLVFKRGGRGLGREFGKQNGFLFHRSSFRASHCRRSGSDGRRLFYKLGARLATARGRRDDKRPAGAAVKSAFSHKAQNAIVTVHCKARKLALAGRRAHGLEEEQRCLL